MFRTLLTRRTDWTVFVVACLISLSLMFLERRAQDRVAWFLQHTALAPAEAVMDWIDRGVGVYWENRRLRQDVTSLRIELDAMRHERGENARLRRLLGLTQRHPFSLLPADVAGRSLDRLGGSLTLGKGAEDGVAPDLAVVTPDGLVGRVERVVAHQARVLTLMHHDCAVAARVARSRVEGVMRWEFGDQPVLHLYYVSSQEDVKPGDWVYTSGLGGIFPEGIRIGTVSRVGIEPNGLMKEILVRPAVNFRTVEQVLVYTPTKAEAVAPLDLLEPEAPADSAAAGPAAASPDSAAAAPAPGAPGGVAP